jgi:hypothetical protein
VAGYLGLTATKEDSMLRIILDPARLKAIVGHAFYISQRKIDIAQSRANTIIKAILKIEITKDACQIRQNCSRRVGHRTLSISINQNFPSYLSKFHDTK